MTRSYSFRKPALGAVIFCLLIGTTAATHSETVKALAWLVLAAGVLASFAWSLLFYWKALLMRAIESTPVGLCLFDANSRLLVGNNHFATMYGFPQAKLKRGMRFKEVFDLALGSFDPERRLEYVDDCCRPGSVRESVHELCDGRIISVSRHGMEGGGIVEVHRDVTNERLAEDRANRARQELFEKQFAIDQAVIVAVTDVQGNITYANDNFCRISGYSRQELLGQNHRILKSGVHSRELFRHMYRLLAKGNVWRGELCNRAKSGRLYWVDTVITPQLGPDGKPIAYMSIRVDITARKEAQARLSFAATHDSLTGLLNRTGLLDQVGTRMAADEPSASTIHLIDLDGFKSVNDTLGHSAGDDLLKQVALRLQSLITKDDLVARLGGDEFAIVRRSGRPDREAGVAFGHRIVESIAQPFALDGNTVSISASVGIALQPEHGTNAADLLKKADLALYQVKAEGRNGHRLYRPAMLKAVEDEKALEAKLRSALAKNELELHYQPILEIETGTIRAAEALTRWRHPTEGFIPPARFIPVAEHTGLILPLSEWIIQRACEEAAAWPASIQLAINVSAIQFKRGNLFEVVMHALLRSGLSPHRLQIEVTETALLEHQAEQLQTFRQLKNMGVALVLDDFGTGYSSATYVTNFPFDEIKIDQSFIQGLPKRECAAVIASAVALAKGLGITITAEGIETKEQLEALRSMGINYTQGYLFSPPVPYADFLSMQKKGHLLWDHALGRDREVHTLGKLREASSQRP